MTTALVQAQKLNVLTVFDLDFFFDFCVALCNADIEYPPFTFEDLQARTSFGVETSIIKTPRQHYCTILRYAFCEIGDLIRKFERDNVEEILKLCRLALPVSKTQLKDTFSPHLYLEPDEEPALDAARDDQLTSSDEFIIPNQLMSEEVYRDVISGEMSLNELIRRVIDMNPVNYLRDADKKTLECTPLLCNSHCSCSYRGKEVCDHECGGQLDVNLIQEQKNSVYPCPCIFNFRTKQLKPGYVLLANSDVYQSDSDDLQNYVTITKVSNGQYVYKNEEAINECFYQFYESSQLPNPKRFNYCVQILQLIELFQNTNPNYIKLMDQLRVQSTFSDYYSSRIDSLFFVDNDNLHDYASQFNAANDEYWNKYQIALKMHQRVQ